MKENAQANRVVVVGAGPVGLTAAYAMARQGFKVVVLEARLAWETTPRAVSFQPGTLQTLERLGILEDVIRAGQRVKRFQFRELQGGVVAEFDLDALRGDTPFPFKVFCPQDWYVRLLAAYVRAERIPVKFGAKVVGVDQTPDGVRIHVQRDKALEVLECDYVVGADGPSSATRKALGISFDARNRPIRLVQVMTTYDLEKVLPNLASEAYVMDPVSPFVLRNVMGCWNAMLPLPNGVLSKDLLENKWHLEALEKLFAINAKIPKFREIVYSAVGGVAGELRKDRGFIIGDAAHITAPFSATGLNCGIQDAYLLAAALQDEVMLGKPALDDWARARKATIAGIVSRSERLLSKLGAPAAQCADRSRQLRETAASPELTRAYLRKSAMLEPYVNEVVPLAS
jgi:3-(3-hydroxy-phenyl)propionate hydroxylase